MSKEKSRAWYNKTGDIIHVFLKNYKDQAYCGQWIDHGLTLLRDAESNEIVGYEIWDVIHKWPKLLKDSAKEMAEAQLTPEEEERKNQLLKEMGFFMNELNPEVRPWGEYEVLHEDQTCKVKKITVKPEQRLSLQRHFRREEFWTCLSGRGEVEINNSHFWLEPGIMLRIKVTDWHRVKCVSDEPLVFIEVQKGESFSEEDIERSEDDYGRV